MLSFLRSGLNFKAYLASQFRSMKLFTTQDIRKWDLETIREEGISSPDLMERVASICSKFILNNFKEESFMLICGVGNNGGDGLAIARFLQRAQKSVKVWIVGSVEKMSDDCSKNLERLRNETSIQPDFISNLENLSIHSTDSIIIDCIFGTGLSRPSSGIEETTINWINQSESTVISIDVPSGLNCSEEIQNGPIIEADYTLSLQIPKRPFLFTENEKYVGKMFVLDIGLSKVFEENQVCDWHWTDLHLIRKLIKPISHHQYKNQKGHLQIVAGSNGKMGAAILSARGAKRSGCGLVTACIPYSGVNAIQSAIPEVMCNPDEGEFYLKSSNADLSKNAIAIGPGIGLEPETALMLRRFFSNPLPPIVIDADALNLISEKTLLSKLPALSVITPHIGEFDRMFGKHRNSFERLQTQIEKSREHNVIIVLKGAYTSIATPEGSVFFNSTGNPGMATAGSGDVLTGVIGSILAQGYMPADAAILGVYLHGLAGDLAKENLGMDGMIASDIIEQLPYAWKKIRALRSID
jgi:hydroxyethylthiazole kinase-like uncharacterized protein yjeF